MDQKRIMLGAYQYIDISEPVDDEDFGPSTVKAVLTTAMDEPFVNRSVTVILTPQYQHALSEAFALEKSDNDLETAKHYDKARGLLDRAYALLVAEESRSNLVDEIANFLGIV